MKIMQSIGGVDGLAPGLSALGHPARLAIVRQLADRDACCCKDVVERLDLAQSTVSQHLKVLVEAGLVDYRPERPRSRYSLNRAALDALADGVGALLAECAAPPSPAREPRCGG